MTSDSLPSARTLDQQVMMFGACLLFMGGLMIGIPAWAPGAPAIGMAHTLGLLEAVFMFAFVALRPQLRFSAFNAWWFCGLTIVAFYCNFAGVCVTVLTGASGGMFLPPWDALLDNSPSTAGTWVTTLLAMSIPSLVLPILLAVGWIDKTRQSDTLQRTTTVVTVVMVVALLLWGFLSS
jgi:ABC-type amino acid transport system permease subunit